MLVLSRKVGEQIFVGDDIVITVVRIGPNAVRLGIAAPKSMDIVREELGESDEQIPVTDSSHRIQESEDGISDLGRRRNSP